MSDNYETAQVFTARWEGGLSNDRYDKGGITKYGVSIAFLKGVAAEKDGVAFLEHIAVRLPIDSDTIISLTYPQAEAIFRWQFWDRLRCGEMPCRMAVILYDMAVNHGRKWAVKLMQRGLNKFASPKLDVDGLLGPKTLAAIKEHDKSAVHDAIITARKDYYRAIVANNPTQKVFLKGWLNRAADLRRYVEGLE